MKFTDFVKSEIDYINQQANWSFDQQQIFDLLIKDRYNDCGIYTQLGIPPNRYYKIKKQIKNKIIKVIEK